MHQQLPLGDQVPRPKAIVELTAAMDCCPSLLCGVLATGEASRLTLGFNAAR